jgi:hypothetical protein
MAEIFDCRVPGCGGRVEANLFVFLQVGGFALGSIRFPCTKCNRLHHSDKELASTRDNRPLYRGENGRPVIGQA